MHQTNCITVVIKYRAKANGQNTLDLVWVLTLFRVCVCPMRIRALEEMMERQKLMRMTERSDRMYLQENATDLKKIKKQIQMNLAPQTCSQDHTGFSFQPFSRCYD